MDRPTKITVIEKNDGYEIICYDEMSGSSIGVYLPINGYKALAEHFRTGVMEISSDELGDCNKPHVSGSASANPLDYLGSSKSDAFKNRHYR